MTQEEEKLYDKIVDTLKEAYNLTLSEQSRVMQRVFGHLIISQSKISNEQNNEK